MNRRFAAVALAGLLLAQIGTPGGSNLGVPAVPGTRVPESNPATSIAPSQSPAPSGPAAPSSGEATISTPAPAPSLSFGAAPPPLVSPNR
jgi:hypothetical protein